MNFEDFFKENQKMIYRMIYRYVRRREIAEELTLDTFMKIYHRWDKVSRFENSVGYLVRVAVNHAKKYTLKRKVLEFLPFEEEWASYRDHPEKTFLIKEENHQLLSLLERLKAIEKQVISLRDFDGLKFEDIALAVGKKVSTVKSHYRRGKLKLTKMWEENNEVR